MKTIPLTQGQHAIVDDEDYERLMQYRWYAMWSEHTGSFYARRNLWVDDKQQSQLMHREVLGLKPGDSGQTDHENHDTLDNRRANLSVTDNHGNSSNRRKQSPHGVGVYITPSGRFRSQVYMQGKRVCLGTFDGPLEAAKTRLDYLKADK